MIRQERRVQKAIDELIKIQDDGYGADDLAHILDDLRSLETYYAGANPKDIKEGRY